MKTKKIISLFLSIVMLACTLSININAYANGWINNVRYIDFDETVTDGASSSDYHKGDTYYDAYYFNIPQSGTITITLNSSVKGYIPEYNWTGLYSMKYTDIFIYSKNSPDESLWNADSNNAISYGYSSARDVYYATYKIALNSGKYYYVAEYYDGYSSSGNTYDLTISYKPNISTPSSLKVSTRNTTSLKLSWSKVSGVSGYQLQRKSGDSYKTLVNTTSTSYTAKKLKAGTTYSFRVRAYKTIDGKKYYSSWKMLKTPTKPSRPSIKTPSTNKKHQIIAKWGKVTNCSGYQVQYSKKKSFSSVIATRTVSGSSKTSYTGKNFTKGRKYYVRVRSYKAVDGKKYYSAWSSVKSIKCK